MAAKGRNFDHIVSIIFNAYICAIFVTVLLYLLGISNSGIQRRGYSAIGFGSANVVGGYILICYLIWLYKARNHIKILIVTAVIALFVYFVINNRSVVFLTLLAPLCLQCFKHLVNSNKGNIILKNTIVWLPVICILICIITAEMYPINSVIQKIDVLFNQRIYLNYRNITLYGVKIFGQYIIWGNGQTFYNPITGTYSTYNTVDNSYICLLIQMGVAMTVIYVLLFAKVAKKMFAEKNAALLCFMVILAFYGMTESSILDVFVSVPFISLMSYTPLSRTLPCRRYAVKFKLIRYTIGL